MQIYIKFFEIYENIYIKCYTFALILTQAYYAYKEYSFFVYVHSKELN